MPIGQKELEKFAKAQGNRNKEKFEELNKKIDDLSELVKSLIGAGTKIPGSEENQSSSSQEPQQPSSTSDSENLEEKKWEAFFGKNKIVDQGQKTAFKVASRLTPDEAQQVWDNGWEDLTETGGISNLGGEKVSYTSKKENITTNDVNLLKHKKRVLDVIHSYIFDIRNAKNLSSLSDDKEIEKIIGEMEVPASRSYAALKAIRENKARELFKKGFGLDISDDDIDAWRKTDLGGDGTNERKAFDNGWIEPEKIKSARLTSYKTPNTNETETNLDVLKVNKVELDKANNIVKEIKATTTFKQIDGWKTNNGERVGKLIDNKLPTNKQQKGIWNIFTNHRNTFKYRLNVEFNEVKGDGLDNDELESAWTKLKEENQWKSEEFKLLTASVLNELLADYFDPNLEKTNLGVRGENGEKSWLEKLGGYRIEDLPEMELKVAQLDENNEYTGIRVEETLTGKQIEEQEDKWTTQDRIDLTGTYKLPFSYLRNNFDVDTIRNTDGTLNKDVFCRINEDNSIDRSVGNLAIGTGIGKTTKTIGCLIRGGESTRYESDPTKKGNNVILVVPNEVLLNDAVNHHTDWLQRSPTKQGGKDVVSEYKCVTHGVFHGKYNVAKNDLLYYLDRSVDPESKKGEYGLSVLTPEVLIGYTARLSVDLRRVSVPGKKSTYFTDKESPKRLNEDWENQLAEVKKKLVAKEETILVFDEAGLNDATYQDVCWRMIDNGYNVIVMSATFPGKDFSISTSKPREVWAVSHFEPEYLLDENKQQLKWTTGEKKGQPIEKWEVQKTGIFIPSTEDEWELNKKGEKVEQIKWGGLTAEQKKVLDEAGICYVSFDKTNSEAVSGITEGMPDGSLFFFCGDHEMGVSPYIHNVIVTGRTQLITLGRAKNKNDAFVYKTPQIIPLPQASVVQQIGRVARLIPGTAYLLSLKLKEIDLSKSEDIAYKFVSAMFGKASEGSKYLDILASYGLNMKDEKDGNNFIKAAIALPYKFGKRVEEIFVGVYAGTNKVSSYPVYEVKPLYCDEELWNKHMGTPTPPKVDKVKTKQLILLSIMTFLNKADITKEIDVSSSNPLIKDVWGKVVPKGEGKEGETVVVFGEEEKNEVIEEVRKVLHTAIDKHRKKLKGYEENKNDYSADEIDTFRTLVGLYRVVNKAKIEVEEKLDKGKMKTVIKIIYPVSEEKLGLKKKDILGIQTQKEIGVWRCHKCLKVNNGYEFCEECGIDVRLDKKAKDKNRLMEELQANIEVKK